MKTHKNDTSILDWISRQLQHNILIYQNVTDFCHANVFLVEMRNLYAIIFIYVSFDFLLAACCSHSVQHSELHTAILLLAVV